MVRTQVRFVNGFDGADGWPGRKHARKHGLGFRFAVIQDTSRTDCADMYFDARLWLSLVEFAQGLGTDLRVCEDYRSREETTLDDYLASQTRLSEDDREPAATLRVYDGAALVAMIDTEFWCQIGGPAPYHDSYTYAVYSRRPMGLAVMEHLKQANNDAWALAEAPTTGAVSPRTVGERVWNGLKGLF